MYYPGHFGKVSQNMCWCAPLPVKPRAYSINPPSLSNKIFLGGIPHDLNERKSRIYDFLFLINLKCLLVFLKVN
jgi:hypothetical protein